MKILVLARDVPTESEPTRGIFEFEQALALQRYGHEVIYLAVDIRSIRRRRPLGIRTQTTEGMVVHVASMPIGKVPLKYRRMCTSVIQQVMFRRIFRNAKLPDIIHSHFLLTGAAATALAQKSGVPLVHTEHSSEILFSSGNGSVRALEVRAFKGADMVIAVSPSLSDKIVADTGVPNKVVPNVVRSSVFHHSPEVHSGFRVVSVGNLIPVKRMDVTIRAFVDSLGHLEDARLTIIGDGPERRNLENLAESLGVSEKVRFLGRRTQARIAQEFNSSDLFVLSSEKETFGLAYAEALASGLPVIATRCGGPEHFLSARNSILADVDDVAGIARAMYSVYSGRFARRGEDVAASVRSKFSSEAVAQSLTEIFEMVRAR